MFYNKSVFTKKLKKYENIKQHHCNRIVTNVIPKSRAKPTRCRYSYIS